MPSLTLQSKKDHYVMLSMDGEGCRVQCACQQEMHQKRGVITANDF